MDLITILCIIIVVLAVLLIVASIGLIVQHRALKKVKNHLRQTSNLFN